METDKKKIGMAIMAKLAPADTESEEGGSDLEDIAKDIIAAVHSKDPSSLASALEAFCQTADSGGDDTEPDESASEE